MGARFRFQDICEDADEPQTLIASKPKPPWTCEWCHLKHEGHESSCNYCGRVREDCGDEHT